MIGVQSGRQVLKIQGVGAEISGCRVAGNDGSGWHAEMGRMCVGCGGGLAGIIQILIQAWSGSDPVRLELT